MFSQNQINQNFKLSCILNLSIQFAHYQELNQLQDQYRSSNMFKKTDPWDAGLKIVSKFLGFDQEQQKYQTQPFVRRNQPQILKLAQEMPVSNKPVQKSFHLKQKWKKLMKFPSKIKYAQTIELLKQGSAMEDETWIWMLKNTQKISPQLYTSRKEELHQIMYPRNPLLGGNNFTDMNIQIQDFQQGIQYKMRPNQSIAQAKNRKVSITKSGIFIKNQPSLRGRQSFNSQASTFSSQTHNSNEIYGPDCNKETFMLDSLLHSKRSHNNQSSQRMKSSYMSSLSTPANQSISKEYGNTYSVYAAQSTLNVLPSKINHPVLTDIIGAFLLHREDFTYSVTLFNMAATFFYYTNSSEIKTFTLLNHVACSEFYLHYLTNDFQASSRMLEFIAQRVRYNCPSAAFLKNFRLQNFIQNWLYGFFYSICQNGAQVKQRMISYLLINGFSFDSLAKVCQSLIFSLARIINQGQQDRIYQCLQNPKLYIDKDVLFQNLLHQQQ